jgi:hypothetical protein
METSLKSPLARWTLCGVLLCTLLFGLAAPAGAQDDFGHATITLYAPGAPAGAWVGIQWQNQAGAWRDVEGWQGPLDTSASSTGTATGSTANNAAGDAANNATGDAANNAAASTGTAFKQWAVYPEDYGRGPFRWVVSNQRGGTALATSAPFFLPDGDGASLVMSLASQNAAIPTNTPAGMAPVNFGFSTITLHAPGAPAGAWVGVQWRGQGGTWTDVEGWQAPLDTTNTVTNNAAGDAVDGAAADAETTTATPFKQWAVFERDYGRGPFRWVISSARGGTVLATSPNFFLPTGNGANLTLTVLPKISITRADTLEAELLAAPTTLQATTSTSGLSCPSEPCNSVISVSVPQAMAGNAVGVQWQDSFGLWHDVPSWQGTLTASETRNTPYQQWSISPELQGRGPFRWVVYNQLGDSLLGVTPGFMLPDRPGLHLNVNVPADFSDIAG